MQYMLMIYGDEGAMTKASKESMGQISAAYGAYTESLKNAGAMVAGDRLHLSAAASTVRMNNGKAKVLNGPYAESKEQLAGYYIIEAEDIDEALAWAAKCPGAQHGVLEVRPIVAMSN